MDIWKEIISIVVSNGVFAVLFVWLFWYQLKDSAKRETKYQQTIEQQTKHLEAMEDVKQDIRDNKEYLKDEDEYEELL